MARPGWKVFSYDTCTMEATMNSPEVESKARHSTCLPLVSRGCCCTLTMCCIVQGWLNAAGSLILMILYGVFGGLLAAEYANKKTYELDGEKGAYIAAIVFFWLSFLVFGVVILASIFFVVGILKNRPPFMLPYIICLCIAMVMGVIDACVLPVAEMIVPVIVFFLLQVYCLMCAESLRVRMIAALQVRTTNA